MRTVRPSATSTATLPRLLRLGMSVLSVALIVSLWFGRNSLETEGVLVAAIIPFICFLTVLRDGWRGGRSFVSPRLKPLRSNR